LNETLPLFSLFFFFLSLHTKKEADDFIPDGAVTTCRREEKQLLFRRETQK
jgi:hypothetical protein